MKSIQLILIIFTLMAAIGGSIVFRSRLVYRLLALFFLVAAIGFIMFPDSTTHIAHKLGVGRGTDLLLYLAVVAGIHAFLLLYVRTRTLERKLTEVTRALAIMTAGHEGTRQV